MGNEDRMETSVQSSEVTLFRCCCKPCDAAEEDLSRLAARYQMKLTIKYVDKEPFMAEDAGWNTPMVYINGHQISHYTLSAKKWEEAMKQIQSAPKIQPGDKE